MASVLPISEDNAKIVCQNLAAALVEMHKVEHFHPIFQVSSLSLNLYYWTVFNSAEQMNKIYLRDASDFSSVVIVDHALSRYVDACVLHLMQETYVHYVRCIDHFLTTH